MELHSLIAAYVLFSFLVFSCGLTLLFFAAIFEPRLWIRYWLMPLLGAVVSQVAYYLILGHTESAELVRPYWFTSVYGVLLFLFDNNDDEG